MSVRTAEQLARDVVDKMMSDDLYSQWLGIEILSVEPDHVHIEMNVREEMVNGFRVCHGGVTFAFADSAFAFACNTGGVVTMSIDNSMHYAQTVHVGDKLKACARKRSGGRRISHYEVVVTNQQCIEVATFRGTAYRTKQPHFPEREAD